MGNGWRAISLPPSLGFMGNVDAIGTRLVGLLDCAMQVNLIS